MKLKSTMLCISLGVFLLFACSDNSEAFPVEEIIEINTDPEQNNEGNSEEETNTSENTTIKILSLGDSYTIGQSVCETCRFPEQLKSRLKLRLESGNEIQLQVIAKTSWTTTNLINAIHTDNPPEGFDLVTLLIGVNNEFQNKPFSIYETEFPQLVNTAISKAKGIKNNVIIVSIPDYAYTPFGIGRTNISEDIDRYNNFAENYCNQNNISYVYITDITRQGLTNPDLVASDRLHPSELAYSKFVERILPLALEKLKN